MLENAGGAGCVGPVLRGVVEAALKRQDGGDLLVVGSTQLVPTPVDHDLVDQLQLMIDPVAVGGKRIFPADGALRLADSRVTATARSWRPTRANGLKRQSEIMERSWPR